MSIYNPGSSVVNGLTALGGSLLGGIAGGIGKAVGQATGIEALGNIAGGIANKAAQDIARKMASKTQKIGYDFDKGLQKRLDKLGLSSFDNKGQVSPYPLNFAGGLSMKNIKEMYFAMDVHNLSRKNFFLIEIDDKSGSAPMAQDGNKYSKFHLFVTSDSHNPFVIDGETIQIGSAEMDKVTVSRRTESNITTYDDAYGSIKEWAKMKCLNTAPSDGTVLPPYFYVFEMRILYGTNVVDDGFYEERYLMRISEYNSDLDRRDKGLEELQLKFVQWDTFMPLSIFI